MAKKSLSRKVKRTTAKRSTAKRSTKKRLSNKIMYGGGNGDKPKTNILNTVSNTVSNAYKSFYAYTHPKKMEIERNNRIIIDEKKQYEKDVKNKRGNAYNTHW